MRAKGPEDELRVCVVIPVFRNPLTRAEQMAFGRCLSVLGRHPIVLLAPETLDTGDLAGDHPALRKETFPDQYFSSAYAYNRLLLSDEFYARFTAYDYMLLHQLDAFVFSDQLLEWCRRGYDYIGAPWIWSARDPNPAYRLYSGLMRTVCRWIARSHPTAQHADKFFLRQLSYATGNGGFSLRRVARMREILAALPARAELYRSARPGLADNRPAGRWSEDVFFCLEANRFRRHVRTPPLKIAVRFAWETNPAIAARLTGGALPFGCHAWDKLHRDQWRPVLAGLGYDLDDILA